MYQQINDQFNSATRDFADTAARAQRLALDNAQAVFGLQVATIEQNLNATVAFWNELSETRDLDGLKTVLPKGLQVARENTERSIGTGQEVLGRTLKANEEIGQIAKGQFEAASKQAKDNADKVVKAAKGK